MLNNTTNRKLDTNTLDEALQEFMNVCKLYNSKLSDKSTRRNENINNGLAYGNVRDKTANHDNANIISMDRRGMNSERDLATTNKRLNMHCDNGNRAELNSTTMTKDDNKQQNRHLASLPQTTSGSIEKLQKRQLELQEELDKVLEIAKSLESKQKTKLSCIFEDQDDAFDNLNMAQGTNREDDDTELIEFQQIENELRVTELNRQLDNIQEELRLRLYKRLMTNMSGGQNNKKLIDGYSSSKDTTDTLQRIARRDSQNTDESTPPSSTCSDETRSNTTDRTNSPASAQLQGAGQQHTASSMSPSNSDMSQSKSLSNEHSYSELASGMLPPEDRVLKVESPTKTAAEPQRLSNTYCSLVQNVSSEHYGTVGGRLNHHHQQVDKQQQPNGNTYNHETNGNGLPQPTTQQTPVADSYQAPTGFYANFRNVVPLTSDLEKIEEGEEECQDYNDSERFRTIYEEKIFPILHGTSSHQYSRTTSPVFSINKSHADAGPDLPRGIAYIDQETANNKSKQHQRQQSPVHHMSTISKTYYNKESDKNSIIYDASPKGDGATTTTPTNNSKAREHDYNNSAITRRTKKFNRPLTLYLPKPHDSELNLLDHVQALGHEPSILSDDLKINAKTAQGYLRKSCANSDKKWLKRYFYFDRVAQTLSYYENEAQLVKKNVSPKHVIPFTDLSDVYVDHRLSTINCEMGDETTRINQKKNNKIGHVFVLVTTKRRYLLATAKAEVMRAWIDILFTAAQANDYFQDLIEPYGEEADFANELNGS